MLNSKLPLICHINTYKLPNSELPLICRINTCIQMYVCMYACVHVCMYTYVCIYTYICMYACPSLIKMTNRKTAGLEETPEVDEASIAPN